jgi:cytoskeletal protein RodZ
MCIQTLLAKSTLLLTSPRQLTQTLLFASLVLVLFMAFASCSFFGVKSDSVSYLAASDGPTLVDPEQIIRSPSSAFSIPQSTSSNGPSPAPSKGSNFTMPTPPALAAATNQASNKAKASLGKPAEPRVVNDANGTASLKIDGDGALVQSKLLQTLPLAGASQVNTRLILAGRVDFVYNNTTYTARLSRANISTIVVLQDQAGSMVAATVAQDIFERIILNWTP